MRTLAYEVVSEEDARVMGTVGEILARPEIPNWWARDDESMTWNLCQEAWVEAQWEARRTDEDPDPDIEDPADEVLVLWLVTTGWEPVTDCGLCERPLPEGSSLPICDRCARTAQAHARLEQSRLDFERERVEAAGL